MIRQADWDIRHYVYKVFVSMGQPPSASDIADQFGITCVVARDSLRRLHEAYALFLRPGNDDILMANPLSAVPTDYEVEVSNRRLFANCAWDALGIPAMLRKDACISVRHPLDGEKIRCCIQDGKLNANSNSCVHFALPFRHWYDDLVDT